jgi:hypothetical protein
MKLDLMKSLLFLAALSVAQAVDGPYPELARIRAVYVLPMSSGLDQFLAVRMTKGGVLLVVTDPKLADAIVTEYIGAGLEEKLNSIYGEKEAAPTAVEDEKKNKDKSKDPQTAFGNPMAGASRSKGAVFLVDRKTRNVLWSDYVRPRTSQPADLNHAADKIVGQLEKDKIGK